jgi:DNA-binding transcriptional LysR family regulator
MGPMNLNALDLNLIRVFDALMAEGSVTRAGDRVGLSQPAVSAALSRLRHALNDQLFIRRGNDMVPTPRAEELADLARSAMSQIGRMIEAPGKLDPATLERTFTLMGSDFVSILMMPPLAQRIGAVAPGVGLRLRDTAIGDIERMLRDDAIDIAIEPFTEAQENVSSRVLFTSPFVLVARRGHTRLAAAQVAEGGPLPIDLYCEIPHALRSVDGAMSGVVDAALEATGRKRRVALALPHFQAVALAVSQSDYLAAMPSQFAQAVRREMPVALYQLPFDVPIPEIKMLWHARHDAEASHRWLREQIAETVETLGFNAAPTFKA